jgi:PP-loop superfamily ATP-utilizing enzyme
MHRKALGATPGARARFTNISIKPELTMKASQTITGPPFDAAVAEFELTQGLRALQPIAIAVSGGVDSLTLAILASRALPPAARVMFHAVSPAVPTEATERVTALAKQERWELVVFDAGEFGNEEYRRNPVNRCFHCKQSLYGSIRQKTMATILSGTNLDDLGEYRPGLDAARHFGVRHPICGSRHIKSRGTSSSDAAWSW